MIARSIGRSILALSAAARIASAQTVREKVAVDVVTVRVTARDSAGKRIEDLNASDLVMTVDGKPVPIEAFSGPERAPVEVSAASPAKPEARGNGPVPGPAARGSDEAGLPVRTMIFVDEVETHPFDRKDVCAELARYLRSAGAANRQFRVARYDGMLRMETGWTPDAEAAASVLSRIGLGGKAQRVPGPGDLAAEVGASDVSRFFSSTTWIDLHRNNVAVALLEAVAAFPPTPGKGRLLVVNGGTSMMRPGDLAYVPYSQTSMDPLTGVVDQRDKLARPKAQMNIDLEHAREGQRVAFEVWSRAVNPGRNQLTMNDVVAKTLERDIELVPVFAEAMDRGDFDMSAQGSTIPTLSPHVEASSAMIELASETGAEAIAVGRKAASRLNEIDGRAAYMLSFRDPYGDHVSHRIALRCQRPGVTIEFRRGYRIPQDDERTLDTVVAGFLEPRPRSNPMNTEIAQAASLNTKQKHATRLAISYAPPLETGASADRPVSIVAVGEDRNGDRTEPVEWSGTASREEGASVFETDFVLNVPPEYAWSVAVKDEPTGLISYVFVPAPARN